MGRPSHQWTDEELTVLSTYPEFSAEQIANRLKLSGPTVCRKLDALGVQRKRSRRSRDWTEAEVAICHTYPTRTIEQIANEIGSSAGTVKKKLVELGIQILFRRGRKRKEVAALQAE